MMSVSLIVPVYNQPEKLKRLLSYYNDNPLVSLIVVDDHSSHSFAEEHKALCLKYKAEYYYLDANSGPSAARYIGLIKSKTNLVAFLDSDDLLLTDAFRLAEHLFRENIDFSYISFVTRRVSSNELDGISRRLTKEISTANIRMLKHSFIRSICEIFGYPKCYVSGWNQSNTIYCRSDIIDLYKVRSLTWAEDIPLKVQITNTLNGAAVSNVIFSFVEISNGRGYRYDYLKIKDLAKEVLYLNSTQPSVLGVMRSLCIFLRFVPSMIYKKIINLWGVK